MNIQKLMKQAQQMQTKMQGMQAELAELEFEGTIAGGAAKVVLSGKYDIKDLSISPDLIDPEDPEMLTAGIMSAYKNAKEKVDAMSEKMMSDATGGMKLPF